MRACLAENDALDSQQVQKSNVRERVWKTWAADCAEDFVSFLTAYVPMPVAES